jgi:hypothetical protein
LRGTCRHWLVLVLAATSVVAACGGPAAEPASSDHDGRLPPVRGAYGQDSTRQSSRPETTGFAVIRGTGFGVVQTNPYREGLDALRAAGLQGMVWLGAYQNSTCAFEHDDAWVRRHVAAIAGHPAILAYYIADEPLVSRCPHAPDALRARTALVHALDRHARTFTVIQAWDPARGANPYPDWLGSGAVDIWGFDVYPCRRSPHGCDFGEIDRYRDLIEQLGFLPYLAVLQDFQDCYYGLPTADDLRAQFLHWQRSRMAGYLVFSWNYTSAEPGCDRYAVQLERVPGNMQELACENSLPFGPDATVTTCPSDRDRSTPPASPGPGR